MMMIPEAWENHATMDPARRAFYQYHSMLMEPWDGPAAVSFTDGRLVGAVLDRNGLRPARYWVTEDGLVVLASEVGVIDVEPAKVVRKGRVSPGKMFLVDTEEGRLIEDEEVKAEVASANPWAEWVSENLMSLEDLPDREHVVHTKASIIRRQRTFGYTQEELRILLGPMARAGAEPLGAMGSDTRWRCCPSGPGCSSTTLCSPSPRSPTRRLTPSARNSSPQWGSPSAPTATCSPPARSAPAGGPEVPGHHQRRAREDRQPRVRRRGPADGARARAVPARGRAGVLRARLTEICEQVSSALNRGVQFVVLSDRDSNAQWAPIPSLLLTSAVHHHLLRSANRTKTSLVVEAGDVREVHHVAVLIGYGASAVNPYLAMESCEELVRNGDITGVTAEAAVANLIKGLGKGVLKIMSKMGISTVSSYCGAQTFEALGLAQELVDEYFHGTQTQLGGVELDVIARGRSPACRRVPEDGIEDPHRGLDNGGEYQWRREGPPHLFNPETVFRLQHAHASAATTSSRPTPRASTTSPRS
jgi:glutamate synthase (NADPH/NADH) large chain